MVNQRYEFFLISEKRALFACSEICFLAALKLTLLDRKIPKYLYFDTISNSELLK